MATRKVIIIGSGPAGYTAAIYAARANLAPLMLTGVQAGGQLMLTTLVENYPGFVDGIDGPPLMDIFRRQAERFGTEIISEDVTEVDFSRRPFVVKAGDQIYESHTVIIATGASPKLLGLESERQLMGRGVSTCATCLPPGASVLANTSPRPIEQIKKGNRVLTHEGRFEKVAGVGSRPYHGELVEIVTRYFRDEPTLLTPDHPVLTTILTKGTGPNYWRWEWSPPEWVQAGRLTSRHILLYPIVRQTKDIDAIRISEFLGLPRDSSGRVHFENTSPTARRIRDRIPVGPEFMRLAGYFLAEGTITSRGINLYFGCKDDAHVHDAARILKDIFDYEPAIRRDGSVTRVECYAGILRDLFQKLFGKYSYGKSMPQWFLHLPTDKQVELVKGYWRGDGGIKRLGFVLVTNSPKLAAQLKVLLLRFGVIPQVAKRTKEDLNKTKNVFQGRLVQFRHDRYELMLGGAWLGRASEIFGIEHPLLKSRTRTHAHAWIKDGFAYLPIAKLSRVRYRGLVYNLAVDNDNSYVTGGATVHNCDGFFFKDQNVMVVGGGDSALEEALYLSRLARKVDVVHRRDQLRASKIMQERATKNPKIEVVWNSVVQDIMDPAQGKVTGVRLQDVKTGAVTERRVDGLFIAIGHQPNTDLFRGQLELLPNGYIKVEPGTTRTSVPGVFAAGDVQDFTYRQAVTAAGTGCMAALEAERYLEATLGH